jgi:hypothetical protein
MEVQSIGLAGLQKAQEKLAAVAKRLSGGLAAPSGDAASAGALSAGAASVGPVSVADSVDLSAEMVALLEAKVATQANLKLVESANELASQTIDILG